MTRSQAPTNPDATVTDGLLAWMGLPAGASRDQVEAAHERLVTYLDSAPPELQPWARQQLAAAEAALLLTADTTDESGVDQPSDDAALAASDPGADPTNADAGADDVDDAPDDDGDGSVQTVEAAEDVETVEDVDRTIANDDADADTAVAAGTAIDEADTGVDQSDFDDDDAGHRRARIPAGLSHKTSSVKRMRPWLIGALLLGVVIGVYQMGGAPPATSTTPTTAAGAAGAAGASAPKALNEALVNELKGRVEKNPNDVDAMRALGEAYYQASDFKQAAMWQQRIIDLHPGDVDARLAAGVALFNAGDVKGAETHFQKAAEADPNRAEVHYNLGFLYLSKDPPDLAMVEKEWKRVIEIDPNSQLAKTASAHLDRLKQGPTATTVRAQG